MEVVFSFLYCKVIISLLFLFVNMFFEFYQIIFY